MKPSKKSPKMEVKTDLISKEIFGRTRTGSIHAGVCVFCGKEATGFKDALSEREYTISGLCQECQDETFGN